MMAAAGTAGAIRGRREEGTGVLKHRDRAGIGSVVIARVGWCLANGRLEFTLAIAAATSVAELLVEALFGVVSGSPVTMVVGSNFHTRDVAS